MSEHTYPDFPSASLDHWLTTPPEYEQRYEHECDDAECPDCHRCMDCESHQKWCVEPEAIADWPEMGRVET